MLHFYSALCTRVRTGTGTALAAQLTDQNGNLAEGDGEAQCADRLPPRGELLKGGEERDDAVLGDGLKRTKTL